MVEPIRRIQYTNAMNRSAPQSERTATGRPVRGEFVGREHEMAEVKTALDDVLTGQGRLVLLVGEPG